MNVFRWGAALLLAGLVMLLAFASQPAPVLAWTAIIIAIAGLVISAVYLIRGEEVDIHVRGRGPIH